MSAQMAAAGRRDHGHNSAAAQPAASVPSSGFAPVVHDGAPTGPSRLFDLAIAVPALAALSPVMAAVAVGVKATSAGPVLYGSLRYGADGRLFRAWKFRSMRSGAAGDLVQVLQTDPAARREYERYRKMTADPRVTRFGRFIRATSLDELPQLVNVVRGDMSIVGPRPKLVNERELYGPSLPTILAVRPGITGPMQIGGRGSMSVAERAERELHYVRNRSFTGDVTICLKTVAHLLRPGRNGAV